MIQEIADKNWMLSAKLERAFEAIIDNNIAFEALTFPQHLG